MQLKSSLLHNPAKYIHKIFQNLEAFLSLPCSLHLGDERTESWGGIDTMWNSATVAVGAIAGQTL